MPIPSRRVALCAAISAAVGYIALGPVAPARGDAYFAAQGTFTSSSSEQFFNVDLSAPSNPLTLRAFAANGGTNAAGQTIAPGGIDSFLHWVGPGGSTVSNDSDGVSLDALLSHTGSGNTFLAPQAQGNYLVALQSSTAGIGDGHCALDLINEANDDMLVQPDIISNSGAITSIALGNPSGGGTIIFFQGFDPVALPGGMLVRRQAMYVQDAPLSASGVVVEGTGATFQAFTNNTFGPGAGGIGFLLVQYGGTYTGPGATTIRPGGS